jgi:hypothetical protein
MLRKSPGVTAAAVLSLALGIGANATIYTWVKSVLLTPLPGVPDAGQIVVLAPRARDGSERSLSYPNYRDIRDRATTFEIVGQDDQVLSVSDGQRGERAFAILATGNFFDVMKTRPVIGRTFLPEEDGTPGAAPVIALSYPYWQRRFGGDRAIVGRTLEVNSHAYTVIAGC